MYYFNNMIKVSNLLNFSWVSIFILRNMKNYLLLKIFCYPPIKNIKNIYPQKYQTNNHQRKIKVFIASSFENIPRI